MNRYRILFFIVIMNTTFCICSCYPQELEVGKREVDLSKKVIRMVLNQNEPAEVRVGLQGITTLQFPAKIEATGTALPSSRTRRRMSSNSLIAKGRTSSRSRRYAPGSRQILPW
jgi:hypothetical protein